MSWLSLISGVQYEIVPSVVYVDWSSCKHHLCAQHLALELDEEGQHKLPVVDHDGIDVASPFFVHDDVGV